MWVLCGTGISDRADRPRGAPPLTRCLCHSMKYVCFHISTEMDMLQVHLESALRSSVRMWMYNTSGCANKESSSGLHRSTTSLELVERCVDALVGSDL